jgi:hypothetical protein
MLIVHDSGVSKRARIARGATSAGTNAQAMGFATATVAIAVAVRSAASKPLTLNQHGKVRKQ